MKRIKFISPIEELSGNLSGKQDLKYPTNNNKAFESPEGSVNYARNYKSRFIGAVRRKDGLCYYSVKTKTATHITRKSLQAMALMGGIGACYAAIVRVKNSDIYGALLEQHLRLTETGMQKTFRKWLSEHLREMLVTKQQSHVIAGPAGTVTIYNPWMFYITAPTPEQAPFVPQVGITTFLKFWEQLGPDGAFLANVKLYDGRTAQAAWVDGESFADFANKGTMSVFYIYGAQIGQIKSATEYVEIAINPSLSANAFLYQQDGTSEAEAVAGDATVDKAMTYSVSEEEPA